ncbi:MAG: hypothetical protein L0J70_06235 [Corynebacterium sp.]|nr:hypothetical protein [Corynebacterium sp.]
MPDLVYTGPTALFLYDERPMLFAGARPGAVHRTRRHAGPSTAARPRQEGHRTSPQAPRRHGVTVATPLPAAVDVRASHTPTSTDGELRRFPTRMYDGAKGDDVLAADLAVLTPGKSHAAAAQWGWLVLRYTDFCIGPGGVDSRIVARRANRRWSGIPHYRDPGVWTFHPQLI